MHSTPHPLQTDRLTLKSLEASDSSFILELVNTNGWLKYIGDRNVKTEEDALKYIDNINGNDNITYWVAVLKDDTRIGIITLIKREQLEYHDIGFAFLPSYHDNGYAYEASNEVLHYVVESTDFQTILASTVSQNASSIKLIEKLGLTFYKTDTQGNNKELSLFKLSLDKVRIDRIIEDFYSAFTNKGVKPDLQLLYRTCIDETIIIKNTNGACETYDLESFIARRKELLSNGTLIEFEEHEVGEQTTITRYLAQRYSQYKKEGILNERSFSENGTKMFQFVKTGNAWKICSVIWNDE